MKANEINERQAAKLPWPVEEIEAEFAAQGEEFDFRPIRRASKQNPEATLEEAVAVAVEMIQRRALHTDAATNK